MIGSGADTFVFGIANGVDTITDFTAGEDVIDLTAFKMYNFSDLTITDEADGARIDLTSYGGGTILLQGFRAGDLDAGDVLFFAI